MISLERYLTEIYTDFEKELDNKKSLCEMKAMNYMDGNIPDYRNPLIQKYYILKYAYAYVYEYYLMYEQTLTKLGNPDDISVLSVGCGALPDYIGLKSVKGMMEKHVNYTGIDQVNWGYRPLAIGNDTINLSVGISAGEYFAKKNQMNADIYMFPKCISEISTYEIRGIAENFRLKHNSKDKFCICVSLRNTDGRREDDIRKIDLIGDAIISNGYIPALENSTYYFIPEIRGIKGYEKDYTYPKNIVDNLKTINIKCKSKSYCTCSRQCNNYMNRYPILKTGEMCYKVMYFERRKTA